MNHRLQKAYQLLSEGDREAILQLLNQFHSSDDEVVWLRANAVKDDEERIQLLSQLAHSQSPYADNAADSVLREHQYKTEIEKPPEYQFWKQPTFKGKMERLKNKNLWFIWVGLVLVIITAIVSFMLLIDDGGQEIPDPALLLLAQQTQFAAVTPSPQLTPSITPLPPGNRPRGTFEPGQLSIIRVENPTNRPVVFGTLSSFETAILAEPARGSHFMAIELEFVCNLAICNAPPEAEIRLQLNNGNQIAYFGANKPILVEYPTISRIAQKEVVTFWAVFEVPNTAAAQSIVLFTGYGTDVPALELSLP